MLKVNSIYTSQDLEEKSSSYHLCMLLGGGVGGLGAIFAQMSLAIELLLLPFC